MNKQTNKHFRMQGTFRVLDTNPVTFKGTLWKSWTPFMNLEICQVAIRSLGESFQKLTEFIRNPRTF